MKSNRQVEVFPRLETARLVLREMQLEDAEAVFQFLSDVEAVRYYDPPITRLEEAESIIKRHRLRFEKQEAIRWGIVLKDTDQLIGNCGFFLDTDNQHATLSYILHQTRWKQGLMTEALQAIIAFAFDTYHLHRIEAEVVQKNTGSLRILQKLGFHQEGILRERFYENDQFHDEVLFSLLKRDLL